MNKNEIYKQIFGRAFSNEELVKYALNRHGYIGNNGYYGITYPSDLDEYQREVEGEFIPENFVEINYWDGEHKEIQIKELEYLLALKNYLSSLGLTSLVEKLKNV